MTSPNSSSRPRSNSRNGSYGQLPGAAGIAAEPAFRHGVEEEERTLVVDRREMAERRRLHCRPAGRTARRTRPALPPLTRLAWSIDGVVRPVVDREAHGRRSLQAVLGRHEVGDVECDVVVEEEDGPPADHARDQQPQVAFAAQLGPARELDQVGRGRCGRQEAAVVVRPHVDHVVAGDVLLRHQPRDRGRLRVPTAENEQLGIGLVGQRRGRPEVLRAPARRHDQRIERAIPTRTVERREQVPVGRRVGRGGHGNSNSRPGALSSRGVGTSFCTTWTRMSTPNVAAFPNRVRRYAWLACAEA